MNLADALRAKIEELEGRRDAVLEDAKPLRAQLSNLDSTAAKLSNEIGETRNKLTEAMKAPRVSDHVVIRWLERKHGFDFEHIREELLSPAVLKAMEVGADGVKLGGGTLKITGKTVVTYIERDQ